MQATHERDPRAPLERTGGSRGRGVAVAAGPRRRRETPLQTAESSIALFALSMVGVVLLSLFTSFLPLILVGVGIPVTFALLATVREHADLHRRLASRRLGVDIPRPYRPAPDGGLLTKLFAALRDPATWRDVAWLWVNSTAGAVLTTLAFALWAHVVWSLVLPVLWLVAPELRGVLDYLGPFIDGTTPIDYLLAPAGSILTAVLAARWSPALLHANAQLTRWLLAPSGPHQPAPPHAAARPQLTGNDGVDGMLRAYAATLPTPVEVSGQLRHRPRPAVEAAVYLAAVEALTNVAAHSHAERCWIDLRDDDGRLQVAVGDNGIGGAETTADGGLRTAERRLSVAGGVLAVSSPVGGPTIVTIEVPLD